MLHLTAFTNGFALSAALIVAIGAQNTFVLRQGLRREHVGPIVLLCAASDLLLMAAGVAGLGSLLKQWSSLTFGLTLCGALFLACYGFAALRRVVSPDIAALANQDGVLSRSAALARAAGFTFLNPHVYLDTLILVGAVGNTQAPGTHPTFVAGAGLASAVWFSALGYGARLLAPVLRTPTAWRGLDGFVGITMLALAAKLVRQAFGTQ